MRLKSYAAGEWIDGEGGDTILNAITGAPVCTLSSKGLDFKAMLEHGRRVGNPALRKLTFHDRALRVKAMAQYLMERKESYYEISRATGATRSDSWIDIEGGIMTLFGYSSKGRRELPNQNFIVDGAPEMLSKNGSLWVSISAPLCRAWQYTLMRLIFPAGECWRSSLSRLWQECRAL